MLRWSPEIPTMGGWFLLDGDIPIAVLVIDAKIRATRAAPGEWRPTTYAGRPAFELVGHNMAGAPLVVLCPRNAVRLRGADLPLFSSGDVSLDFAPLPGIPVA